MSVKFANCALAVRGAEKWLILGWVRLHDFELLLNLLSLGFLLPLGQVISGLDDGSILALVGDSFLRLVSFHGDVCVFRFKL